MREEDRARRPESAGDWLILYRHMSAYTREKDRKKQRKGEKEKEKEREREKLSVLGVTN